MQTGYKLTFKPKKEQSEILVSWLGAFANVWNSKINENEYYFSFGSKFVPITQWRGSKENKDPKCGFIDASYAQFKNKELSPWLYTVPSQLLRNAASRWYETQWKYMRGECGAPKKKKRHDGRSMYLTREMFTAIKSGNTLKISVGTNKFPVGELDIHWRKGQKIKGIPNSITIRRDTKNKWYVSFSVDDGSGQITDRKEMQRHWLDHLRTLPREDVEAMISGLDRGVAIPVASETKSYDFTGAQKRNLESVEIKRKRWQRKLARQQKGSNRSNKTKRKIAQTFERQTNIRVEFAHQTAHKIVRKTDKKIFILEDLNTKGMTKSASGTLAEPGKNVAQKSGLNKAILNVGWNRIATFLIYKALREGKIVFKVNAHHTSQECSHCGNTHSANRREQSIFACQDCGHTENADRNAAKVIAKRAVNLIFHPGTGLSDEGVLRPSSVKGRRPERAKSSAKQGSTSRQKRSAA